MVGETWFMTAIIICLGGSGSSLLGNASILKLFRLLRLHANPLNILVLICIFFQPLSVISKQCLHYTAGHWQERQLFWPVSKFLIFLGTFETLDNFLRQFRILRVCVAQPFFGSGICVPCCLLREEATCRRKRRWNETNGVFGQFRMVAALAAIVSIVRDGVLAYSRAGECYTDVRSSQTRKMMKKKTWVLFQKKNGAGARVSRSTFSIFDECFS